jgi:hypothetical protein
MPGRAFCPRDKVRSTSVLHVSRCANDARIRGRAGGAGKAACVAKMIQADLEQRGKFERSDFMSTSASSVMTIAECVTATGHASLNILVA